MARPKKPITLQTGNIDKKTLQERELQENSVHVGKEQLQKPPTWLRDTLARKEWKRLLTLFEDLNFISDLDYNNLGAYCNSFSSFIEASNQLKKEPLTTKYTNKQGFTNTIQNPLINIQKTYSEEMKKYAGMLGLSIDSRLKVASLKTTPGKTGPSEFDEL